MKGRKYDFSSILMISCLGQTPVKKDSLTREKQAGLLTHAAQIAVEKVT